MATQLIDYAKAHISIHLEQKDAFATNKSVFFYNSFPRTKKSTSGVMFLLFLLYFNDMPLLLKYSNVIMNAYDTSQAYGSRSIGDVTESMNTELENLKNRCMVLSLFQTSRDQYL